MHVQPLAIPDVKLLTPKKHGDHRGFFSEVFNLSAIRAAGITGDFVQDNHSLSVEKGVLRGLHYQVPPKAQGKLIRVIRGAILDVAVDIRRSSPTFGQFVSATLSDENWTQIWVPPGFAHAFITLQPNTEVVYKVTDDYSPQHERGIRWNDPAIAIPWPAGNPVLSERDRLHPLLADQVDLFP